MLENHNQLALFPDANALFSRRVVYTLLGHPTVKLLPNVADEIRAHRNDVLRNCQVNAIEVHADSSSISHIQTTPLYDVVLSLVIFPSALLQNALGQAQNGNDFNRMQFDKALQYLRANASCFDFDSASRLCSDSIFPQVQSTVQERIQYERKRSMRSMFKYANAYLTKSEPSVDETLAASAITFAMLNEVPSAIISDDKDFLWIMKQFTDNLVLSHLVSKKLIIDGKKYLEADEYEHACRAVDEFRVATQEQEWSHMKRFVTAEMNLTSTLRICSQVTERCTVFLIPIDGQAWGQYSFPSALLNFLFYQSHEPVRSKDPCVQYLM